MSQPGYSFRNKKRGYIKEGYYADLVMVDLDASWTATKENTLYKCGWTPFEGTEFKASITQTFVNGNLIYDQGQFNNEIKGKRIQFNR